MTSYGKALAEARASLHRSGIKDAALDARLLLANAAGIGIAGVIARDGDPLLPLACETFRNHIDRRMQGEPVARILGEANFWGLRLRLNSDTLVPRAETETLVEVVLAEARGGVAAQTRICDLGTGSGAIAIALLSELPAARAVATDISEAALSMAKENAERHGVAARIDFRVADFAAGPEGPFDIVVSNPPYIRSEEIAGLQREVRQFDPRRALDGGPDGLDACRAIIGRAGEMLAGGGVLALEIGYDQGGAVVGLCREGGLADPRIEQDLGGRDRVVIARARI